MSFQKEIFPCLRGVMGDWVYYSVLMTAAQIEKHIVTAKSIRETNTLDDYLQRDLTKNVKKISGYLSNSNSRMFNSMIIGVFGGVPDWLSFDLTQSDKLNGFPERSLEKIGESIGLLILDGDEEMFAIDGQHRAEAIKETFNKNEETLEDDQYSVILVAHNDTKEGKKRSRKLFADINQKAIKVSKGDLVIIDEEDPSAIVARKIYSDYIHFDNGNLISLTKNANMTAGDVDHFTNLLTIHKVVSILKSLHPKARQRKFWEENEINDLAKITEDFLDFCFTGIDEYKDFFGEAGLSIKEYRYDNPNLLFRPIGFILLAKIYSFFRKNIDLPYLKSNINKIDFSLPGIHFNKIVWNDGRIETKHQITAFMLTKYLLNRLTEDELQGDKGLIARFDFATKESQVLPEKVV